MTLGTRLKGLRRSHHFTQKQLADLLQVTNQTICHWEKDLHRPRMENLCTLAAVYQIPLSELEQEIREETFTLPSCLMKGAGSPFILQAEGDGMRGIGIRSGDYLVFDRSRVLRSGDIAAVEYQTGLICRQVFVEPEGYRVHRADGRTPDLFLKKISVRGILICRIGIPEECGHGTELM